MNYSIKDLKILLLLYIYIFEIKRRINQNGSESYGTSVQYYLLLIIYIVCIECTIYTINLTVSTSFQYEISYNKTG